MQRRLIHFGGGLAVAVTLVSGVQAESSSLSSPADPALGATQSVPPSERSKPQVLPLYRSPLNEYRSYRVDEPLRSWKGANDEAGRLGGHMGYLTPSTEGGER